MGGATYVVRLAQVFDNTLKITTIVLFFTGIATPILTTVTQLT